jgi:hypothetical protein
MLAAIRHGVLSQCRGRDVSAFRLGELVDQWDCPPDVFRDLYESRQRETAQRERAGWGARRLPEIVENLLANTVRSPGDLPERDSWLEDMRQVAAETGISIDFLSEAAGAGRRDSGLEGAGREDSGGRSRTCADSLAELVRERLRQLSATLSSTAGVSDRLQFNEATQTVTLDGCTYSVRNRIVFLFLMALYRRREEEDPIPAKQLPSGKKGRIDKLLKRHLPLELRRIVQRQSGRGGGYWLCVPQKSP